MTVEEKLSSIVKFISEQQEQNPAKSSFNSDEIQRRVFQNSVSKKEVEFLCRKLIKYGDVKDVSCKDEVCILHIPATDDAFWSNKYLNSLPPVGQKSYLNNLTILVSDGNILSNSGVITGNVIQAANPKSSTISKSDWFAILGLILTGLTIFVAIALEKGWI